jgi:hypothetical protein
MAPKMKEAMEKAIQAGMEKRSIKFIDELKPLPGAFAIGTSTNRMDYSEPPFPMLPKLLQGGKLNKDGSGIYKIIPVGKPGKREKISDSLSDIDKAIFVKRLEESKVQYNKIVPDGSKQNFKTASSKQNPQTQWIRPAKEADFTQTVFNINDELESELKQVIDQVINDYESNF